MDPLAYAKGGVKIETIFSQFFFGVQFPLHLVLCRHFALLGLYRTFVDDFFFRLFMLFFVVSVSQDIWLPPLIVNEMRFISAIILLLEADTRCWYFGHCSVLFCFIAGVFYHHSNNLRQTNCNHRNAIFGTKNSLYVTIISFRMCHKLKFDTKRLPGKQRVGSRFLKGFDVAIFGFVHFSFRHTTQLTNNKVWNKSSCCVLP